MFHIHRIVNIPVPSNCFVLYDKSANSDCIIVDPGTKNNEELIAYITKQELTPVYIILTHEHFDHCWGVNELLSLYHVPIVCSKFCAEAIKDSKKNCSVFYDNLEAFEIDSETISVEDLNFKLFWGSYEVKFYLTPGHTDASISFTIGGGLFTGDALIKDMRTVTKLPTGSMVKLKELLEQLKRMQGYGFEIYPGHGDVFELDGYDLDKMTMGQIDHNCL